MPCSTLSRPIPTLNSTQPACIAVSCYEGPKLRKDGKQEDYTKQAGGESGDYTIATKVYPTEPGMHKPARLRATFETSLKELGVEAVDIFYLHAPDRSVPFEEILEEI